MALQTLDIPFDSSQFDAFIERWEQHRDQVAAMPSAWKDISKHVDETANKFEEIFGQLKGGPRADGGKKKAQQGILDILTGASGSWRKLAHEGVNFFQHIGAATKEFVKWAALRSAFTGLIGAGGLWGLDRMAGMVTRQRTSAMGLDVTTGQKAAFETYFARLGDAQAILGGLAESLHDIGHQGALVSMFGGNLPEEYNKGDVVRLWTKLLPRLKQLADTTDPAFFAQTVEAYALQQLGITPETLRVLRNMPHGEMNSLIQRYKTGAVRMDMPPDILTKWTELNVQLTAAGPQDTKCISRGTHPAQTEPRTPIR